jgi:hypothetical protein
MKTQTPFFKVRLWERFFYGEMRLKREKNFPHRVVIDAAGDDPRINSSPQEVIIEIGLNFYERMN